MSPPRAPRRTRSPWSSVVMLLLGAYFLFASRPNAIGWTLIALLLIGGGVGMLLWLFSVPVGGGGDDKPDAAGKAARVLERLGFTPLAIPAANVAGDISGVLVADDGAVVATVYDFAGVNVLSLETELSDGSFILTSSSRGIDAGMPQAPPRVAEFRYSPETTTEELVELHREQVHQAMIREPSLTTAAVRTFDELAAARGRLGAIRDAHARRGEVVA